MTDSIFADKTKDPDSDEFVEIELTVSAQEYLAGLLQSQDEDVLGIRVFINEPGTTRAETCVAYCRADDIKEGAIERDYSIAPDGGFRAWFDAESWPYLESAKIDYAADKMGGQLTIKAPNSKLPQVSVDSPLAERINYLLQTEVNPSLAAHGGQVSLMAIDEDNYAILQFGGGCQGCSAVDLTLKDGVEKTLKQHLPDLAGVKDVTDHSDRSSAYY